MLIITQNIIIKCQQQIDIAGEDATIVLIMPGKWGSKNYRTLYGVKGEIVCENNGLVVVFPAKKLKEAAQNELKKLMAT